MLIGSLCTKVACCCNFHGSAFEFLSQDGEQEIAEASAIRGSETTCMAVLLFAFASEVLLWY